VTDGEVALIGTEWPIGKVFTLPELYERLTRRIGPITRSTSGAVNANQVGGTVVMVLPLALALAAAAAIRTLRWIGRIPIKAEPPRLSWRPLGIAARLQVPLALVAAAALLPVLILSQSRSALIGLVVALVVLLALLNRWLAAAAGVAVMVGIAAVRQLGIDRVAQLVLGATPVDPERITSLAEGLTGRQELWTRAVYMIQDLPFTGAGLGMFDPVANILYPFVLIGPSFPAFHAHNVLLQVGTDVGLPGLVAYVALMSGGCLMAWRAFRRPGALEDRAAALGLLGGIVAYHSFGLTDAMTLGAKPGVILWMILGLAAAMDERRAGGAGGWPNP